MPVSIPVCCKGLSVPSAWRSNCMNTLFHTSKKRSHPQGTLQSALPQPNPGPRSKNISVHGPQGPTSPICQKLSSPSLKILCSGTPISSRQIANASSSEKCTETESFSLSKPMSCVKKFQAKGIASFLK